MARARAGGLASATRESINRALAAWGAVVEYSARRLVVRDVVALRALAGDRRDAGP